MSDVRNYARAFIAEFIELYKSLPSLWNVKSREYSDRNKKRRDYQKMIKKLKEIEPDATRDSVTRRINSLRSSYRKEKKKLENSLISGTGEVHTPTLWYYSMFNFLTDQEAPSQSSLSLAERFSKSELNIEDIKNSPPERPSSPSSTGYSLQTDTEDIKSNFPLERPLSQGSTDYSLPCEGPSRQANNKRTRELDNTIYYFAKRPKETSEDYYNTFGRTVAYKLRNLPREQRIFAEKIINDALFEAELGSLNRNSYIHIPVQKNEISPADYLTQEVADPSSKTQ